MEAVILARHGESVFSERLLVNGDTAVPGPLTPRGVEEAEQLGRAIADDPIDVCVTSEFERTRQTADLALGGRDVPRLVVPELNDPLYGSYEGGALEDYRAWADSRRFGDEAPGGGESRRHIVERYVRGFRLVLSRPERVRSSSPIRFRSRTCWPLATAPRRPARVPLVEHAHPYRLRRTSSRSRRRSGELVRLANLVKLARRLLAASLGGAGARGLLGAPLAAARTAASRSPRRPGWMPGPAERAAPIVM